MKKSLRHEDSRCHSNSSETWPVLVDVKTPNNSNITCSNNNNNPYGQTVGMEFIIFVMKSRKQHLKDGMELPNQDKIWTLREKETYKYLGTMEADTIK